MEESPNENEDTIMAASIACKFGLDGVVNTKYPARLDVAQVESYGTAVVALKLQFRSGVLMT